MLSTSKLFFNPSTGAAKDPYFPYVPLLLESTTTNGQQNNTFLDSSTNNFTITRNGTPTQGSVTPYWPNGYWSNNFNGSTDTLTTASTAMSYAGDFSIECWFNTTTTTNYACLYSDETGSTGGTILLNNGANNGQIVVFIGTAVSAFTSTSTGLNNGTWNHVALTRSGSTVRLFVNGALQNTTTASGTITTASTVRIGSSFFASRFFGGYISNFRIVVGSPVYTTAFTPSAVPLTPITNTTLLTCQSNRFIDNSATPNTITVVSTPKVQAFQPFSPPASYTAAAYGGSGYFNGSTDYLTGAASTALAVGTNPFTVEMWIYFNSLASNPNEIFRTSNDSTTGRLVLYYASGSLQIVAAGGAGGTSASYTFVTGQWYHVAASRDSSNNQRLFVNGALLATATSTNNYTQAGFNLGRSGAGTNYISAQVTDFRLVNGTAVYTAAFTPPTAPLTAITNTSLLLNYTNAGIYDAAVQNNAITVGSAQASTTVYKWSPTSMKFNGTTDYLSMPSNPAFAFGTGNFTIEAWVYITSSAAEKNIVSTRGAAGSANAWSLSINTSNGISFYSNTFILNTSSNISLSTWTYVAVTREGTGASQTKLYINGLNVASATSAENFTSQLMAVGASNDGSQALFNGYLQDVRITKGYARTITTPTAAFPTR